MHLESIKIKNLGLSNDVIKRVKKKSTKWNVLQSVYSKEDLCTEYIKSPNGSRRERQQDFFFNEQKISTDTSLNKISNGL